MIGSEMNRAIDGITIQRMLLDRALTFSVSFVSRKSHIIDRTEIKGIDANSPPINVLLFEISETITIIPEEINTLMI